MRQHNHSLKWGCASERECSSIRRGLQVLLARARGSSSHYRKSRTSMVGRGGRDDGGARMGSLLLIRERVN